MSELDTTKKIEKFLMGLEGESVFTRRGGTSPPPPPAPSRPRGFGAPSPARTPSASSRSSAARGTRAAAAPARVEIPYYADSRYFRPEASETFANEQGAAREYRESLSPSPEGYNVPSSPITSEDIGMTNLSTIKDKGHRARIQFVDWLKTMNPEIYSALVSQLESGTVGATSPTTATTPLWQRIVSGLSTLTATVAGARAQRDILNLNIQRAEQGLPPVDAASMAPVVRTEVAITPEMAADLRQGANKALMYGGIAVAALFLWKLFAKRR